jgi:hypothetical protein
MEVTLMASGSTLGCPLFHAVAEFIARQRYSVKFIALIERKLCTRSVADPQQGKSDLRTSQSFP